MRCFAAVPTLIVFLVLHKQVIAGLSLGSTRADATPSLYGTRCRAVTTQGAG
jgi:hypothetical protein